MRGQPAALLLLVFAASRVSGRPAESGDASAAKSDHTIREETLARLLREELRTLEGSRFPMSGMRRDSSGIAAVVASDDRDLSGSSTHMDGPRDASVDLAAVPESAGGNRVSSHQQYEVGRSLGSKDLTPSEEAIVQPRPPPYRDSDHLAEKRALPPHVVKARSSGDGFMKVRSRSRPVYKPLYSSSEHLAARPAIPLPQIEAYLSSKAAESIAVGEPSLVDETKEDAAAAAVTQVQELQGLSTVFPPRFSSTKAPFQTPTTSAFVPKSTAIPLVPELVPEPVEEKPVLLHAVEELAAEDTVLHPSSKAPPVVPGAATTEATRVSDEAAVTEVVQTTTEEFKTAATPQKPAAAPSVDERPPQSQKEKPAKSVTTAPTVSFPTNLYLPDALVLSNQHSKPQHSRFSPATLPHRRTATPAYHDDRRTSATASTTKAPPPFPPRRRMTFQPFRKTTTAAPPLDSSTDPTGQWQKESPVPPHYAANDELDVVRRKEPEVRPLPDTTKNLFISTEPSVNTAQKFPEVPQEQDDDHHVEQTPSALPGEIKVEKNEQAALPASVDTPFGPDSASSSADEVKKAPSSLDKSPGSVPAPAADAVQAKPFHYGLDEEVAPAVVAGETSVGDAAVPSKVSPTTTEEESAVAKPAPDFTSGSDEGSLGLPGSIGDQQSALEILEQLHKAEEAPVEEPSALADPPADADGQPSFNINDMMVSLAMGEGEGSDTGSDQAPSAPQEPAHLTDIEGRVIY